MYRIFPFLKKERALLNEDDLTKLEKNHKYFRNKRLSDFGALIFCLMIVGIGIVIVTQYNADPAFKSYIIEKIRENLSGFVFTIIALAGVKWVKN